MTLFLRFLKTNLITFIYLQLYMFYYIKYIFRISCIFFSNMLVYTHKKEQPPTKWLASRCQKPT